MRAPRSPASPTLHSGDKTHLQHKPLSLKISNKPTATDTCSFLTTYTAATPYLQLALAVANYGTMGAGSGFRPPSNMRLKTVLRRQCRGLTLAPMHRAAGIDTRSHNRKPYIALLRKAVSSLLLTSYSSSLSAFRIYVVSFQFCGFHKKTRHR